MELGYEKASQRLNIKACTLRQWAKRGKWNVTRNHSQELVTTVTQPIQILADELAQNERETRLSLSRYAKRAAKDSEGATIRDAPLVHKVGQLAGIVHKWGTEDGKSNQFTLNVLNINSLTMDQPE